MTTALLVLQLSGISIALVGIGRERWLRRRWFKRHHPKP